MRRPEAARQGHLKDDTVSRFARTGYLLVVFETASAQWQAGLQALEASPFDERPILEKVTRLVQQELRRRLGGAFTIDELVALYEEGGTGWVSDIATAAEPDAPFAWDVRIVGDAAFARYLRSAVDYAGGRRV